MNGQLLCVKVDIGAAFSVSSRTLAKSYFLHCNRQHSPVKHKTPIQCLFLKVLTLKSVMTSNRTHYHCQLWDLMVQSLSSKLV